ncbi:hypothetical protein Btru_045864 [Bulinus truncatus]|nr:hypothetical protein Btru_045864 [Bulinus truncatus]
MQIRLTTKPPSTQTAIHPNRHPPKPPSTKSAIHPNRHPPKPPSTKTATHPNRHPSPAIHTRPTIVSKQRETFIQEIHAFDKMASRRGSEEENESRQRCAQVHTHSLPACQPRSSEVDNYLFSSPSTPRPQRPSLPPSQRSGTLSLSGSPHPLHGAVKVHSTSSRGTIAAPRVYHSPPAPHLLLNARDDRVDVRSSHFLISTPEPVLCEVPQCGAEHSTHLGNHSLSSGNSCSKSYQEEECPPFISSALESEKLGSCGSVYESDTTITRGQSTSLDNGCKKRGTLYSKVNGASLHSDANITGQLLTHIPGQASLDQNPPGRGANTPINRKDKDSLLFYFRSSSYDVGQRNNSQRPTRNGRGCKGRQPSGPRRSPADDRGRSITREIKPIACEGTPLSSSSSSSLVSADVSGQSTPGSNPRRHDVSSDLASWPSAERTFVSDSHVVRETAVVEYGPTVKYITNGGHCNRDGESLIGDSQNESDTPASFFQNDRLQDIAYCSHSPNPHRTCVNREGSSSSDPRADFVRPRCGSHTICDCDVLCSCALSGNHLCPSTSLLDDVVQVNRATGTVNDSTSQVPGIHHGTIRYTTTTTTAAAAAGGGGEGGSTRCCCSCESVPLDYNSRVSCGGFLSRPADVYFGYDQSPEDEDLSVTGLSHSQGYQYKKWKHLHNDELIGDEAERTHCAPYVEGAFRHDPNDSGIHLDLISYVGAGCRSEEKNLVSLDSHPAEPVIWRQGTSAGPTTIARIFSSPSTSNRLTFKSSDSRWGWMSMG